MRASYFYAWTPVPIVFGTLILLTSPYLALVALLVLALGAVAAVARGIVFVTRLAGRAVPRPRPPESRRIGVASPGCAYAARNTAALATAARSTDSMSADSRDRESR